jgi:hypothetical protein
VIISDLVISFRKYQYLFGAVENVIGMFSSKINYTFYLILVYSFECPFPKCSLSEAYISGMYCLLEVPRHSVLLLSSAQFRKES